MSPNELRDLIKAVSFRPLRVTMNSGQVVEIPHRDFATVTVSALYVFPAQSPDSVALGAPTAYSIRNISTVEPLPDKAA